MSDTYSDILLKNLININLDEHILPPRSSIFSPEKSVSTEQLAPAEDTLGCRLSDIWSENAPSKPPYPFRPDRSMSLTDNYLSNLVKKPQEMLPPPPGFPPMMPQHSNRYKTELCRSYQENGSCKYGTKCQFAHGESELRGLYRHPKYKTEACRTFYNFGYCPYGSRCHFIHEEKLSPQSVNQKPTSHHVSAAQNPRLLRQSVSFAGFLGSRSSSPPAAYDPLAFSRAPSVSPPPSTDLLSPVFSDTSNRDMFAFPQARVSEVGDNILNSIPLILEPQKASRRCLCGQGTNFQSSLNKYSGKENRNSAFVTTANMQRFPSDESLSDRESYSSSGSESPTFDGSGSKRLTVFARMSLSE